MTTHTLPTVEELPVHRSPSGLETVYIAYRGNGTTDHFVAIQTLRPGERVFRHTHTVEETLLFLSGDGVASLGDAQIAILPMSSLVIPAGMSHGFANTGEIAMTVVVVFPVPYFAETVFTGEDGTPPDIKSEKGADDGR